MFPVLVLIASAACASSNDAAPAAADAGPSVPPPPAPAGTGVTPTAPPPVASPTPSVACRRDALHTASVALFDALTADLAKLAPELQSARIDAFLADLRTTGGAPLEDPASDRVVVVARGAPPSGAWAVTTSEVGFDVAKATPMIAVAGDLWAAELTIPRNERFTYKLLSGTTFLEDPLAPNVEWDGVTRAFGVRGEFNAVGHASAAPKDHGRLVALGKQHATKLGDDREVFAYLPARYDDGSCAKLPSVVFHDGNESLTRGDFAGVADALYRARPELSAVLVFVGLPSQDVRMTEYGFGDGFRAPDYVDFLAADLWPTVTKRFRVCGGSGARGISGASLGGLVSTFAAFEKPGTWGWVGAQSASFFWGDDALIQRASSTPKLPTRFYLDSGCPEDNCDVTNQMAAVMQDKGYDVLRVTAPGAAHEWSAWNARLAGMLTHFREGVTACE